MTVHVSKLVDVELIALIVRVVLSFESLLRGESESSEGCCGDEPDSLTSLLAHDLFREGFTRSNILVRQHLQLTLHLEPLDTLLDVRVSESSPILTGSLAVGDLSLFPLCPLLTRSRTPGSDSGSTILTNAPLHSKDAVVGKMSFDVFIVDHFQNPFLELSVVPLSAA